jgi:hypothetical protein
MNTRNNGAEISRMPLAEGRREQLTPRGASFPSESSDEKMICYVKSGVLFRVPPNGGEARS